LILVPDPIFSSPDPGSGSFYIPDPDSGSRGKKAPNPGSANLLAMLQIKVIFYIITVIEASAVKK
jgi:hypothetical protein